MDKTFKSYLLLLQFQMVYMLYSVCNSMQAPVSNTHSVTCIASVMYHHASHIMTVIVTDLQLLALGLLGREGK